MKICHMTSVHTGRDVRIFLKECTALAEAGYDTYLVAPGGSREENGVHVVGVGEHSGGRISRMTAFSAKVFRAALSLDAEIYHLHDPELIGHGLRLKELGKKVIFDSHEDTLEQMADKTWIPRPLRGPVALLYRAYARRAFSRFDALISVTPHICGALRRYCDNVVEITNYPLLTPGPCRARRAGGPRLCFTGGVTPEWQLAEIIEAVGRIEGAGLTMFGPAHPEYLRRLASLPDWGRVSYLGVVRHEESAKVQANADAGFAVHTYSRNFGGRSGTLGVTKLFEYMAAGIPVICTDFDLWREIVETHSCGICVEPGDIGGIAAAIAYLRDHPDEAEKMGANGRRAVEDRFNWDTQRPRLLELYARLAGAAG